ncbi:ataxin-1-like [Takifugu flavidus]|uniref:Ataxin-1 Spinocerebellar ataxia type 1 protein n=1 Tax=Takifugu flavidus TaxID=433684 RepID=A0A5C6N2Z1_9TELE|nr:ataxin-1-like [Takifugu flavidus]XP_056885820.1 ataxin-1-like [Takifugu flavidus]XP_056885821.1 ataxin-1-like [Takifugu flavidus]TWW61804.1 Ataxin-1 Spinocerebellar ataxia type 1 protein [Takifugu flavidus]
MLSRTSPAAGPDRDNLPLKKRDQRWNSPPLLQRQQQSDGATFKAPYPHRSCAESRFKNASPFQPFPKRVPSLHQPWMHAYAPTRSIPQVVSAFGAHQGWADWRESKPLRLGWERGHSFPHHGHPSLPLQAGQRPSRFSAASGIGDAFQSTGDREQPWGHNFNARRNIDERNGGPFLKRSRKAESHPNAGHPSLNTGPTRSPQQVLQLQSSAKLFRNSTSGLSFPKDCEWGNTNVSVREVMSGSPPPGSRAPNRLPWLLPHFLAGSLIELRDGRLRRVEHLQTEDFLLGALACPDLRLSCCTVQSIALSTSSAISRLLILLHDQQSQELVDVYVEYPFFVQDHGWSSCSPQRTARLCGLQCRQLCVGDICLALTPLSTPQRPLPTDPQPEASPTDLEQARESPRAPQSRVPTGPGQPAGQQKELIRRRHRSAPELSETRTECAS